MNKTLWIIVGVVAIVGFYIWSTFNGLVGASISVDGAWAQVETQYQRRLDLIPNLVNSVKGILAQEQEVFGAIADARTKYGSASSVSDKVAAANQLESAFGRLLVVLENYPQLRSTETVQSLMAQLEGAENRISVERKRFNDGVQDFNLRVRRFPSSLIARVFNFLEKTYFEAASGAENAPKVEL